MTIEQLYQVCKSAYYSGKGDLEVVFDTEAMCFDSHLVNVSRAILQDDMPEELGKYLILNYDMPKELVTFFRPDERHKA